MRAFPSWSEWALLFVACVGFSLQRLLSFFFFKQLLVFFFKNYLFIYLFLAVLHFCCCAGFSLVAVGRGYSLVAVCRLLVVVTSFVEYGLYSVWASVVGGMWTQELQFLGSRATGSAVVARELSRSVACGLFLEQGSNPCPLHWQVDSHPLCHQGGPPLVSLPF